MAEWAELHRLSGLAMRSVVDHLWPTGLLPIEHCVGFPLKRKGWCSKSNRRPCASHLVPTQTNKNLSTNAIKGLSIPSRSLARVRSGRDDNNKINIFGIFMI